MFHHVFSLLYKPIGLLYVNKVNCISLSKKKKLLDSRQSKQDRENNKSRLNYLFFFLKFLLLLLKIPLYVAAHVTLNCS